MYDMHYDLLTILYLNKKKDLKKIYRKDNIIGGIINLYFMTKKEMKDELDINIYEMKNIKNMFKKSIENLNKLKKENIIPLNTNFIYSIEGCDYIKNIKQLEELYNLGLRSIILTWNHKNKYGSGYRTNKGLTYKEKKLIKKAIELNIIIDVSHANCKTFNNILDVYKKNKNEKSIIIASHSNVKSLCNNKRNLTDKQLLKLKDIGGYIGLFTNSKFLSNEYQKLNYELRKQELLKHLDYIINTIKFDTNKILISTDDMDFHPDKQYHDRKMFQLSNAYKELDDLISNKFGKAIANKILIENPKYIINQVKI